ncbi:hypothetical protein B0H16DRAFT_539010 [Mycena metata]|uniref:Uncharacterized protein n=1 Tax=Mycena metata TaxID=1033252 RepID=A0AAD7JCK6_9AGAR|nr:hypothetical protein B0H16DRAFT_539010 [Mycena metata]
MAEIISNIREGYIKLTRKIHIALRTQMGDADRLAQKSDEVARFLSAVEPVCWLPLFCRFEFLSGYISFTQHHQLFSAADLAILQKSAADMQEALEEAMTQSSDPLTTPLLVVSKKVPNGKGRGRHRIDIDHQFLASALELRGPTGIAASIGCHPRTVRRRALQAGLAVPAPPVCQQEILEDGSVVQVWQSTGPPIAAISNDPAALDQVVNEILQLFPEFGREMLSGALRARRLRVPKDRITASYLRVRGVPPMFGDREIDRRIYSVPGVNSLWHHDGQHGE